VSDCLLYKGGEEVVGSVDPRQLRLIFSLVLAAECRSNHPIAKGIADYCTERLSALEISEAAPIMETTDFDNVLGKGVRLSFVDEDSSTAYTVIVGNSQMLEDNGVSISESAEQMAFILRSNAKVVVFVALNGELIGVFGLGDQVRPEARHVLEHLSGMGIECHMVTGDNAVTAAAVAEMLNIPANNVLAGSSPKEKESYVSNLMLITGRIAEAKNKVAFVGDGTNDTPALSKAQVGVVMSSGTDLALECGDLVLCKNSLESLATAIDLSTVTMRRIYINYFWALIYNSILIPIAAGALVVPFSFKLNPMIAGGAMAVSSVSVVLSSLWLNFYSPPVLATNEQAPVRYYSRVEDEDVTVDL
jgi:Cu+-exporting ATPase